jgi:hypothetical protein
MPVRNSSNEAGFLQGPVIAGFSGASLARPSVARPPHQTGGLGLADSNTNTSETTLTCWNTCSVHISGC